MISLVDHQVGRILEGLQASGLAGNTLIAFASDHGDMHGDHGLYLKGPMMYEGVLRVPLIVSGPGVPGGHVVDTPVSTIDLAATFLDSAGLPCPSEQSRSLHPVMVDGEQRTCAWSEWHVHPSRLGVALKLNTVRTARYSYTVESGSGDGELYDLQEDPHQLHNRFDDPGWQVIREEIQALLLAVTFIYMILASQFRSFLQPVAIMASLPLSLIGVMLALLAWRSTLNMFSVIGFIMLMGLVTKNAILLIDFANQQRRLGVERSQALLDAAAIRLRPILMTTLAMVFGMLPLAFSTSEGSEQRAGMGHAVIGGVIASTLLTLLVVPVLYTLFDELSLRFTSRRKAQPLESPVDPLA
jgi:hypothetical protein